MYFARREIKPYIESVSSEQLRDGGIYFAVNYVDHELLMPTMDTLVFIGRNLEPGDAGKIYFQDVTSHREGAKYDWEVDGGTANFFSGSENQASHIFEYEQALDNMLGCLLRRRNLRKAIPLYFEGRELKAHAEPVSSKELRKGEVYFAVNFIDKEMLIPIMETLVFIGRNLQPQDVAKVYFQDIESHSEGTPYDLDQEGAWAKFKSGSENEISHIFTYEKALDVLMQCSLRRKQKNLG